MSVTTVNPATGSPLTTYASHTDDELKHLVQHASEATRRWASASLDQRAAVVGEVAVTLRERAEQLAALITLEMGKPLAEAEAEIEKSAVTAEFYAAAAAGILSDRPAQIPGVDAWVAYEPLGLVYAVMPWNFPFWQAMRFALPALTAGNGVFLKHSPNVTGSALAIQRVCEAAGLPPGVFTTVVVEEERVAAVSATLIADDRIAAVTLTGSNRAGEAVGAAAGRAVKKTVLELGGSDAFVVLGDADVEKAAATAVRARFTNAGQSCVCAKRFVVDTSVAAEFTTRFVDAVRRLRVGDPFDAATDMGPLARSDLRDTLRRQVDASVAAGARLLVGGSPLPGDGFYFAPTVLADAVPGMPVFDEETFGPVAAIATADGDQDAVRLANSTQFGLGLSVWSADRQRALDVARRITSGAAFINAMVASDARVPFGGTKRSGHGRELSDVGLREFVNTRTYWAVAP